MENETENEIDLKNVRTDCRFYNEIKNKCKAVGEKSYRGNHVRADFYYADNRRCKGCSFFKPKEENDKTKGE